MKRLSDLHPKITDKNKQSLYKITQEFIELTWNNIKPELYKENYGLNLSGADLKSYLPELMQRGDAFAWAWMRARCEDAVISRLVINNDTTQYIKYLRKTGRYWFRETPYQHLKLGYHTAISCFWKMLGGGHALYINETGAFTKSNRESLFKLAKSLATFNLEMLIALDGILWDGAAATPLEISDELKISDHIVETVKAKFIDPSARLGCPALRTTAFLGIQNWCELVFDELYLPNISHQRLMESV